MGYITEFSGSIKINKPVERNLFDYINRFCATRHMTYDKKSLLKKYPNECILYGLEGDIGENAIFFAPKHGEYRDCVSEYNHTPSNLLEMLNVCSSALWCAYQLVPKDDFDLNVETEAVPCSLESNGAQKSYNYFEWLRFLCTFLLKDYKTNGVIVAMGESSGDANVIIIHNSECKLISANDGYDDVFIGAKSYIENADISSQIKEDLIFSLTQNYFIPEYWEACDTSAENY